MTDGFTRPTETVRKALETQCAKRAVAVVNRDRALHDEERAGRNALTYEGHVAMCDHVITGLLDELLRSRESEQVPV